MKNSLRLLYRLAGLVVIAVLVFGMSAAPQPVPSAVAQALAWEDIEAAYQPDEIHLAWGDPDSPDHGVYAWPFDLDSLGHVIQSYQYYGGDLYFHHGMDIMKFDLGTGIQVFNRSGGQVVNIENYQPGWDLYWEVAVLDPDGYLWQYHHIDEPTIPDYIYAKYAEYLEDPVNGGFIEPDTHIGNIIPWPVWSFGKYFNHIHLNIIAAGGYYVNGLEFHVPLPDTDEPVVQTVGLLKDGAILPGTSVTPPYSLYVRSQDLVLDDVYYLPPWKYEFSLDCGYTNLTYQFDRLPGIDRWQYLNNFYVSPTCGDYECRDFYVNLGFIKDSQFIFPKSDGQHTVAVTVSDYAGNSDSQVFNFTVDGEPNEPPTANPQAVETNEGQPVEIILTGEDPNYDPVVFTVTVEPAHGTLSGEMPALTYTPDPGYTGPDSFTFTASDCQAVSAPAVVDITVGPNTDPVADDQQVSLAEDTPAAITLTGSDADGDELLFQVVTQPEHGILGGLAPDLVYTPTLNYNGSDVFTFVVSDTIDSSAPALVSLTVSPVNDAPALDPIGAQEVIVNQEITFTVIATDPEEDGLVFALDDGAPSTAEIDPATGLFRWTPTETGVYTVTIRVTDDGSPALDDAETITITVTGAVVFDQLYFLPVIWKE